MLPRGGDLVWGEGKYKSDWPLFLYGNVFVLPGVPQFFKTKLDTILHSFIPARKVVFFLMLFFLAFLLVLVFFFYFLYFKRSSTPFSTLSTPREKVFLLVCAHTQNTCTHTCVHACMCAGIYYAYRVCVCVSVCMCVCVYVCVCVSDARCKHLHVHVRVYMYTHTHTHTHADVYSAMRHRCRGDTDCLLYRPRKYVCDAYVYVCVRAHVCVRVSTCVMCVCVYVCVCVCLFVCV
jgi:hypothetical protein